MSEAGEGNEGAARRAAQARAQPVGGVRRDPASAREASDAVPLVAGRLPLVGHLQPGRRRRGGRGQGGRARPSVTSWCASGSSNGVIVCIQLRTIADLAERHGRGIADITVRQNFQLHWVTWRTCPTCSTRSGHARDPHHSGVQTTRNITGCPVAGLDADELVDASPLVIDRPAAERQSGFLQPAAQVQGLDHGLPRLVLVRRSTTSGSPRFATRPRARSASRSASAAGCRPIRIWQCGSTRSSPGAAPGGAPRSPRFSGTPTCCDRIASAPA